MKYHRKSDFFDQFSVQGTGDFTTVTESEGSLYNQQIQAKLSYFIPFKKHPEIFLINFN
jgi:hypothetical protein